VPSPPAVPPVDEPDVAVPIPAVDEQPIPAPTVGPTPTVDVGANPPIGGEAGGPEGPDGPGQSVDHRPTTGPESVTSPSVRLVISEPADVDVAAIEVVDRGRDATSTAPRGLVTAAAGRAGSTLGGAPQPVPTAPGSGRTTPVGEAIVASSSPSVGGDLDDAQRTSPGASAEGWDRRCSRWRRRLPWWRH
jgi:hypothetical protein